MLGACSMSQCQLTSRLPVKANCFFAHYVKITVVQIDNQPFAYRYAVLEPLIVKRAGCSKSKTYHSLSFIISVESDPTLAYIIVVVGIALKVSCLLSDEIR